MIEHRAHHDALSSALFEAVEVSRDVVAAFRQVETYGDLVWEHVEPVFGLLRGELVANSFSDDIVLCLRMLAESIETAIVAETRTSIHFDECCMSGAWEEKHMTERGHALTRLQGASNVLADRISTVIDIKRSQSLAIALTK